MSLLQLLRGSSFQAGPGLVGRLYRALERLPWTCGEGLQQPQMAKGPGVLIHSGKLVKVDTMIWEQDDRRK
jgi:hypothetical protein